MPPNNLPSDSNQKRILRAFREIGFTILPPYSGKGSHQWATDKTKARNGDQKDYVFFFQKCLNEQGVK
ncbi:MAG: hypothetical protein QMD77_00045 [Patescibacteria group bacterium]|nr:hypothetical protein [Patescibacteria group bacterium]